MDEVVKPRRRWGRWLLITFLVLLMIGYSILWFATKPMIESFADDWVDDQRRAGIDIQYSERRVVGFPLNFKLVFDDPVVEAPDASVQWTGEQIRLHSRPWNFYPMLANRWGTVEGYAPGDSTLRDSAGIVHSLSLDNSSRLLVSWNSGGLKKANLKFGELSAVIDGENFETEDFVFAMTPSSNLDSAFDMKLSWDSIDVPQEWIESARDSLTGASPAIAGIISGIINGLESGEAADIPMPNALSLGDQPMIFGLPFNY